MAESQQPLDAAEIEFLLEGNEPKSRKAPAEGTIYEADFVTIRGDLANISLTDIFQTLCMSQMVGTLRIKSTNATKQVFFTDGKVQMVDDQQVRAVQIGTRLRQAGFLSEQDLNQVLARQRREGGRLSDLLVAKGLVDREQMEELLHSHEQGEIFALFTWKRATFEFFKGEPPPEGAHCSDFFDVSGILLEVARRQDEWAQIHDKIGDLDEVLLLAHETSLEEFDPIAARLLPFIDGARSVREIAASSLLPLFECAKTISNYLENGRLRKATLMELAELVERQVREGRPREAVSLLSLLREEREVTSAEEARKVASACLAAHDPRGAAQVMVGMATRLIGEAPGLAFELLGDACAMDPSNAEARLTRRTFLIKDEDQPEIRKITLELCDIFCEAGKLEEALQEAQKLKDAGGLQPAVLARLARVNHKAGKREEAEQALTQLADIFREQGKTSQLIAVLDQIVKLNPARRDAARELRAIKATKAGRKRKRLIAAGGLVALGLALALGGTVLLKRIGEQALLERLEAMAAKPEPSPEDLDAARQILAERPESPTALVARRILEKDPVRLRTAMERQERDTKIREVFEEGQRLTGEGRLAAALGVYEQALAEIAISPPHQGILTTVRLPEIAKHLQRLDHSRRERLARIQDEAESFNRWEGALAAARELADPENLEEAERIQVFLGRWPFSPVASAFDPEKIANQVSQLKAIHKDAAELLERLEQRHGEYLLARELDPLLHGAQRAEEGHAFAQALELYSEVARRYRKDNELSLFLHDRVKKYRGILDELERIESRARAGDHQGATEILARLERAHPGLPFAGMIELPLQITSTPPGARVLLEGSEVGRAPLRVRFKPTGSTSLRLELPGYSAAEETIQGIGVGALQFWLAPIPAWISPLPGLVDSAPILDGDALLVSDRAGNLSRLHAEDGRVLWRFESKDLSGNLSAPLVWEDKVFVASPEAGLRCLDGRTGEELWRRPLADAPIGAPLATQAGIVVATNQGRLHCFSPKQGAPLWNSDLEREITAPPTQGGGLLFLAVRPGLLLARDATTGAARYSKRLPYLCVAQPTLHVDRLFLACMDGTVLALTFQTGKTIWERKLSSPCRLPILAWEDRLLALPADREAHVLAQRDGTTFRSLPLPAAPSAPAALVGSTLFLGLENGHLLALDAKEFQALWRHEASRSLLAPAVARGAQLFLATQDREVLALPGAP